MNKPTVTVVINSKTGERTYEVEGMQGMTCEDVTQALIQANQVKEHEYTSEFYDMDELPATIEGM